MAGLEEAIRSANRETNFLEYIRLVKSAVIRSVEDVDSDVQITDTGHFNHSAHPDLVLRWRTRGVERPMFLRQFLRRTGSERRPSPNGAGRSRHYDCHFGRQKGA